MPTPCKVVVVGSVNRDYVIRIAAVPLPGQTLLGGELTLGSGGKGGNQAVAAALLGADTAMVACVGDDSDGAALVADLAAAGVDVTSILEVTNLRTGTAFVMVADDGENAIVVAPGANNGLDAATVGRLLEAHLGAGDLVVLQAETPVSGVTAAVEVAGRIGARVVLNLAPYRDIAGAVLATCDPVVVNEGEARSLLALGSEESHPTAMAQALARRARSAVITLGGAGAVVAHDGGIETVAAPAVRVIDTTGAGDAFIGAMAAALSGGADLTRAVQLGVAVGSYAVGRAGAQASYPRKDDLSDDLRAVLPLNRPH